MATKRLTHLDSMGRAKMVNVAHKPVTQRQAVAEGYITLGAATVRAIMRGEAPKGEVFGTARLAGIMAAKRCGELIPLCHPLPIESVELAFELPRREAPAGRSVRLRIRATVCVTARTGVEMEALVAVAVAALTVYDMCKAIDKTMRIGGIRLVSKSK